MQFFVLLRLTLSFVNSAKSSPPQSVIQSGFRSFAMFLSQRFDLQKRSSTFSASQNPLLQFLYVHYIFLKHKTTKFSFTTLIRCLSTLLQWIKNATPIFVIRFGERIALPVSLFVLNDQVQVLLTVTQLLMTSNVQTHIKQKFNKIGKIDTPVICRFNFSITPSPFCLHKHKLKQNNEINK